MIRSATIPMGGPMGGPNVPQFGRMIPIPDAPIEPVLSLGALLPAGRQSLPSVLDTGPATCFTAGRYAIAWALKLMGLGPNDQVLLPAYHCAMMVEPLSAVSATPVFYRINDDLSVDMGDIRSKLTPSVKAIMATHYFGFPQHLKALRALCDEAGIFLLEDCAHAYFGTAEGRPMGAWGDYTIASPRKFFPVSDGGYLIQHAGDRQEIPLQSYGLKSTIKVAFNFLEHSIYYGRLPIIAPLLHLLSLCLRIVRGTPEKQVIEAPRDTDPATNPTPPSEYNPARLNTRMSLFARMTLRVSSKERMIRRRRDNYEQLREGFSGIQNCRSLFEHLPDGVAPHMFPLWIDDLDSVFPLLEDLAVPMQRFGQFLWSGVDETTCRVSSEMSHHLIQLPCHQELSRDEISLILTHVRSALAKSSTTQH